MAEKTRIVIVGGGYGGIEAAKRLYKEFKRDTNTEITLIDKNPYHTLMTELHEVAGSRVEPESVMVSFNRIFAGKRINIVTDKVVNIDFQANKVIASQNTYEYDYVVIGSGAEPEFFGIKGIQENAFTLWSLEDALEIREHINEMFRKAAQEPDPEKRKKLLTFVVAGAGFTGVEMAGELLEHRDTMCRKYALKREDVSIIIVEALSSILTMLHEDMRGKAMRYMEKKGIQIMLNSPIVEATSGEVHIKGGKTLQTDTFIWTCGVMGSSFAGNLDLTKGRCTNLKCKFATSMGSCGKKDCQFKIDAKEVYINGKRGRLQANEYMQSPDYPNVYLVGDNIWFVENNKPLPQIVETALQTGECAAHNIIADIKKKEKKSFASNYHGFMVSIGGKYGVSFVAKMKLEGFFSMAMKHLINLHYLLGLAGINAVWAYLKHEFFEMKENRSFVGGHLAAKIPIYWGVLLRVWLGFMWVVEGANKISEGWLDFSTGKSKTFWMFSKGIIQAGVKTAQALSQTMGDATANAVTAASMAETAVETVTAASGTATTGADTAVQAVTAASDAVSTAVDTTVQAVTAASDAATTAVDTAVQAVTAASDAAGDAIGTAVTTVTDAVAHTFGPWIDTGKPLLSPHSGIVHWFTRVFMDGIFAHLPYTLFQVMIVVMEIGIGLALMGGCFTWLAALASIGMCLIFTLSGMFSVSQLWFIFAGIVMLGGAGKGLGLDYWMMRWLKKWWNGRGLAQRSHLYLDEPVIRKKNR